jgi:tetratricopeptide (TPR) repeat protein
MCARIGLGRIELARGSPDRALGWFLSARDAASDNWQPFYWQGCAQAWLGDHQGAHRSLTSALEQSRGDKSVTVQRAYVRFTLGDLGAALEDLLTVGEDALDDKALLVLASLHLQRSNWADGERILRARFEADPSNARTAELMGAALERQERPDEATIWYERAAKLDHRRQASLEEALRRDPTNAQVRHAVTACWLNSGQESVAVPVAIAAVAALLWDDEFWERFQSDATARYQAAIGTPALVACRRQVERLAYARAGHDHELLLLRELTTAEVLRDLGGLPSVHDEGKLLVGGPLMISLAGLEAALADFVAREGAPDDARSSHPRSSQWRRLRQLCSGLGVATALLAADRPEEALAALAEVACERCRSATAPADGPTVCKPDCLDFNVRHPSYACLPGKEQRLAEDAARLLIASQLGVARRIVATDQGDVDAAIRLWGRAIKASTVVGQTAQTHRQIVDTVLGRAKALQKRDRSAAAITLLEAAERVLGDSPAREELSSELAQLLTDRGVLAANHGRLDQGLEDLRRAAQCSPHASRPWINLSRVLQRLADQRRDRGDHAGEYELLRQAKHMLEDAGPEMSGIPQFAQELVSVRRELRAVCNRWAIELSATARYDDALEVLSEGLLELPGDAALRASQQSIHAVRGTQAGGILTNDE